jgi:ATP-dependent Clp protease ATP-binding subunit ClpC
MFERYTEKARRVIFFARYEASQFGSPYIETEHILLGLLREDKALAHRFLKSPSSVESIRKQIEQHVTIREKVSTSVDLPLTNENKRVLAYAAEEAERMTDKHIGTEHLFLGLLREEKCFGAELLRERGVTLSRVREELARAPHRTGPSSSAHESGLLAESSRDLTKAATDNELDRLIGRSDEMESIIEALCCRTRNSPVLIGEPGVGKTVIVEGLAQRIADGEVPNFLADKHIVEVDLAQILAGNTHRGQNEERLKTLVKSLEERNSILFAHDLTVLVGARSEEGSLDGANILRPALMRAEIQCIWETTPTEYETTIQRIPWFVRCSRPINVLPLNEAETIQVLHGLKERYEKYHAVSYTDDALICAAQHSNGYVLKATDVLDAAGARVKLKQTPPPEDVSEVQKRIKFIEQRMEKAIANHEFEKARFYSDEERKERDNLRSLREKYHLDQSSGAVVGREVIEQVISRWS